MNTTMAAVIAATLFVTGFVVVGMNMGGQQLSAQALAEKTLNDVPLNVLVAPELKKDGIKLDAASERKLRSFLAGRRNSLDQCDLQVTQSGQSYIFADKTRTENNILISFKVRLKNGQSFATKPRKALPRNLGSKAVQMLGNAWQRFDAIRTSAYKNTKNIVDL